jgi:hypothetical protein
MMNIMARYSKKTESETPVLAPVHAGGSVETLQDGKGSTMMKMVDLSFPDYRPCRWVFSANFLPGGRIVTLGESSVNSNGADTLYLYEPSSSMASRVLMKDIAPATNMTVTSTGDVLLLMRDGRSAVKEGEQNGSECVQPIIRIFNVDTGAFINININLGDTVIGRVGSIATDEQGFIFLMHGNYPQHQVLVFRTTGTVIQNVNIGDAWGMAYCRHTNVLYVVTQDRIVKYRWNMMTVGLTQISSSWHGLHDFYCWDVSIGSSGKVFVAGMMQSNKEVSVYEVKGQLTGDLDISLNRLKFYDEKPRIMCCYSPRIAVHKNQLILAYCDEFHEKWKVEVFTGDLG